MRKLLILILLVASAFAVSVKTIQTTIGAATTQVTTTDTYCRQITFQNNALHAMHVGDSATSSSRGVQLNAATASSAGGSWTVTTVNPGTLNAADFWVNGTQNDVLDTVCTQ